MTADHIKVDIDSRRGNADCSTMASLNPDGEYRQQQRLIEEVCRRNAGDTLGSPAADTQIRPDQSSEITIDTIIDTIMEENQDIRIIRRLATELKIPVLRDRLDHYIEQCGLHNWDIPHLLAVIMQDQMAHRAETRRRNLIKEPTSRN